MRIACSAVFSVLVTIFAASAQNSLPRGVTHLDSGGLRLLHGPNAAYPAVARTNGIAGTVEIEAALDAQGHVVDAHVVSGAAELRAAALKSILDDHFAPDVSGARTVHVRVIFSLESGPAIAQSTALKADSNDAVPVIGGIECNLMPADLCRDAHLRVDARVGSPFTPENRIELQKTLESLDDDLFFVVRKVPNAVALVLYLRGAPSANSVVGGGLMGGVVAPINAAPPPPPVRPSPPVAGAAGRIKVGAAVQEAKLIRRIPPVYPPLAKQDRIQGVVTFAAVIGKDGTIQDLQTISGHPLLVGAALNAVKQWQYQTTLVNGEPVEVATQISMSFSLSE